MIDPDSVEQVRQAADLVELLRGRVELVRRGGRWWARCPFHDERSPSFTILPDHKNYYCFGCGAKGDAFTWMREREGAVSFNEAVEAVADRFGVELRYVEASPQQEAERAASQKRTELLQRASHFYSSYLWKADEAEPARRYLMDRGFDEELLRSYGVGYAPGAGSILAGRAAKQGYTRQQLVDAGLARDRGGAGMHDFFASRIMFPIANGRGQVQGFGGRTLDPNERAKYVNSPEGRAFQKRRLLFALDRARASAAKLGWVAVTEGYTDVLALAKAGYDNAVACMGTSLTAEQLRLLARTADEVRLCFDGDRAGQEAAWRSVEAAQGIAVRLSAVPLPAGRDPGELAADAEGLEILRAAVENPEPMMSYLVRSRIGRAGPSAAERDLAYTDVAALLARFPESIAKDDAVRLAVSLLGLSRSMEDRLRAQARGADEPRTVRETTPTARLGADEARERRWLALAAALGDRAAPYVSELNAGAFDLAEHKAAYELLAGGTARDAWPEEMASLAVELQAAVVDEEPSEAALRETTYRLQERSLERQSQRERDSGNVERFLKLQELLQRVRQAIREGESE